AGDCICNLRASLDYIAWQLAMLAGNSLTEAQKKKITFPIAPDNASFTRANGAADHLERVCGVPAATISVIESVQSYHAGYEPLDHLHVLVNVDKHRLPLLTVACPDEKWISVNGYRAIWSYAQNTTLTVNKRAHASLARQPAQQPPDVMVEGEAT